MSQDQFLRPDQPDEGTPESEPAARESVEAEAAAAAEAVPAEEDTFHQTDELPDTGSQDRGTDKETAAPGGEPKLERLQKILARAGIASRRHGEELISQGRVQLNGKVVTELGTKADPARDHIRVDGKLIQGSERHRYFMLNKPKGFVTTVSDPEGRPTIMEFFRKMRERLYPVGRLDYLSEGLLVVTNDGELANKLTRAASGVEKTYLVKVSGRPSEDELQRLREGVSIDRGKPGSGKVLTSPASIRPFPTGKAHPRRGFQRSGADSEGSENPWFEVVLVEGRNRELRKMFEQIGHHVEKIRRVGYGPLVLDLEPGKVRELSPEELQDLRLASEGKYRKPKARQSRKTERGSLPREGGPSLERPFRSEAGRAPGRDRGRFQRPGGRGGSAFGEPRGGPARNRFDSQSPRHERPGDRAPGRGQERNRADFRGPNSGRDRFAPPRRPSSRPLETDFRRPGPVEPEISSERPRRSPPFRPFEGGSRTGEARRAGPGRFGSGTGSRTGSRSARGDNPAGRAGNDGPRPNRGSAGSRPGGFDRTRLKDRGPRPVARDFRRPGPGEPETTSERPGRSRPFRPFEGGSRTGEARTPGPGRFGSGSGSGSGPRTGPRAGAKTGSKSGSKTGSRTGSRNTRGDRPGRAGKEGPGRSEGRSAGSRPGGFEGTRSKGTGPRPGGRRRPGGNSGPRKGGKGRSGGI